MSKIKKYREFLKEALEDERNEIVNKITVNDKPKEETGQIKSPEDMKNENPEDTAKKADEEIHKVILDKVKVIETQRDIIKKDMENLQKMLAGANFDANYKKQLQDRYTELNKKLQEYVKIIAEETKKSEELKKRIEIKQ